MLKGDTRSLTPDVQDQVESNLRRMVGGVCAAHGVHYELTYRRNFVPTINAAREAEIAAEVARTVVGEDRVLGDSKPVMTSEDFGYMLQEKPGAYLLLGNGRDGVGGCSLHNPHYDFNDALLCTGADFWVAPGRVSAGQELGFVASWARITRAKVVVAGERVFDPRPNRRARTSSRDAGCGASPRAGGQAGF